MNSPTLPTNFNETDQLIDYGKDLGISVGLKFLVPAVVLSLVLIIVFIKLCGGSKETRIKFSSTARAALIVIAIAVLVLAIVSCAVGWSYNEKCHSGVQSGVVTLQGVIDSTAQVMSDVNTTVTSVKSNLLDEVNQTNAIVNNVSTILVPLHAILGVVGSAETAIQNLSALTVVVANNITAMKSDLGNLQALETEGIITGVPNINSIPNIDNQYTEALNSSLNNLDSLTLLVNVLYDNVSDTLNTVADTISSELIAQTNDYNSKADDALSYFLEFFHHITNTNKTFNRYSPDALHYSSIRKSVIAGVLVLPITLSAISLVGIVLRMKAILKISAAFCFVFMFWYFVLAGLNYAGYFTIHQFCHKQDIIVGNTISIADEEITVPGTNVTILVSQKVVLLLKCSGNNTLIDIFEFSFLIDDLTGAIQTELISVNDQVNELNQTAQYKQIVDDLFSMENNSSDLDYLQNKSLPSVQDDLNNVATTLNNTINSPAYFNSLANVNSITNNLKLTNGTFVHMYYDPSNITTLNCTVDPYDKLNQSAQADLCAKAATAIVLTIARNNAIAKSVAIYGNITDINQRLDGIEGVIPTIAYYQNETSIWANEIHDDLDTSYDLAIGLVIAVQEMAQEIAGLIYSGTDDMRNNTMCAYVGDAYIAVSGNVCSDVKDSLEVISAMMILGACVLFLSTITSMVTVYKMDRESTTR